MVVHNKRKRKIVTELYAYQIKQPYTETTIYRFILTDSLLFFSRRSKSIYYRKKRNERTTLTVSERNTIGLSSIYIYIQIETMYCTFVIAKLRNYWTDFDEISQTFCLRSPACSRLFIISYHHHLGWTKSNNSGFATVWRYPQQLTVA